MIAELVVIAVILVGLPVLAWWVGGRGFWNRLRPRSDVDLYREIVRRHRLLPAEIPLVEGAVTWGRRLDDPRLRAAAVDWARAICAALDERHRRHPRRWGVLRVVLALYFGAVVVFVGWRVAHGDLSAMVRLALYAVVLGLLPLRMVRGPRRAIERNSDASETGKPA